MSSRLLAAVVADDLVDLDDDVLGNLGINGLAIDHLCEGNAFVIILCDRNLTEHLVFVGNDYTNNITRYVRFPCTEFLQRDEITGHDDR